MFVVIGTFTGGFMGGAPSEGLYVFEVDPRRGDCRPVQTVGGLVSPSFLCRHPSRPLLYSVERQFSADRADEGGLTTWRMDPATGRLEQLGRCPSGGAFTAHVAITRDGRVVTTANPLGPTVASFLLDEDGVARRPSSIVTHHGRSARERQSAPWPHSSFADAEGARLLACDLGLDRVMLYDIGREDGRLEPSRQPFAQVSSGAGCRHLAFHPGGRFVYVVNELDCSLSVFAYDAETGSLIVRQTVPTVPGEAVDTSQPAEIVVHPAGHCLYVTNRGHESVAVFAIDAEDGRVRLIGHEPTLGDTPRHIALSPDGAHAFVANQLSGEVAVFAIDAASGRLTATDCRISVPSPSCCLVW